MKRIDLSGIWSMDGNGFSCQDRVPGSVYSFLLNNKLMNEPSYRTNEDDALELMNADYEFSREFEFEKGKLPYLLHCDGLDTICDIYLNNIKIGYANNMFRSFEYDITDALVNGVNKIKIHFYSPIKYIKEKEKEHPIPNKLDAMVGFSHIRKANCMFGWDWGPRLPDAGIWRDIYIYEEDSSRITDVHILQRHSNGQVFVTPIVKQSRSADIIIQMTSNDGGVVTLKPNEETEIINPELWWPNGMGEQALYSFTVLLEENGKTVDSVTKKIGLRTLKLIRKRDKYGESFYHEINGVAMFAMGADYIPEDNILSRINPERTRTLLNDCKECNFNTIRVWGGGFYPDDYFYDICDEMGLIVFQDLMFACTLLYFDEERIENVCCEVRENLRRIRHHACVGLISGNNEIESCCGWVDDDVLKNMYIDVFEGTIPQIMDEECPEIDYIPSSPTTCGHFIDPYNENYGDCHYWDVWHGGKPFTEYRKFFFRYLSEFGFQSFPCEKTVDSFTEPEDRNIFSRVMEIHQRNGTANGKILNYLSETYKYPTSFSLLLYASQLLQMDAIRYGVEHFRRNRGRCMGTLYWQLNDIWPGASWASIDYFGRYKALQYSAKRFYAPILISCVETGEKATRFCPTMEKGEYDYQTKARLYVTNDRMNAVNGVVQWSLRDAESNIILQGQKNVTVPALSVFALDELDFHKTDVLNNYFSFAFVVNGETVSEGTALFTEPKHFNFKNPELKCVCSGDEITVNSSAFAKSVEIYSPSSDFKLSDNFFDMNSGVKKIKVLSGNPEDIHIRSVYDIK
jgi:beta-mannosidase